MSRYSDHEAVNNVSSRGIRRGTVASKREISKSARRRLAAGEVVVVSGGGGGVSVAGAGGVGSEVLYGLRMPGVAGAGGGGEASAERVGRRGLWHQVCEFGGS